MSVAVIDHMKEIKLSLPGKPKRVSRETIQPAFSRIEGFERASGDPLEMSRVRRTQALSGKIRSIEAMKILEQHLAHQIHAQPVFLQKVANDAYSGQTCGSFTVCRKALFAW
jgi:hypothetical protein